MIGSPNQGGSNIDQRITGKGAVCQRILYSAFDRGTILPRNIRILRIIAEPKSVSTRKWGQPNNDVRILTTPADLLVERPFDPDRVAKRLVIRNLRFSHMGNDSHLLAQSPHENLEMELSHAGNNRLICRLVVAHMERWILKH